MMQRRTSGQRSPPCQPGVSAWGVLCSTGCCTPWGALMARTGCAAWSVTTPRVTSGRRSSLWTPWGVGQVGGMLKIWFFTCQDYIATVFGGHEIFVFDFRQLLQHKLTASPFTLIQGELNSGYWSRSWARVGMFTSGSSWIFPFSPDLSPFLLQK